MSKNLSDELNDMREALNNNGVLMDRNVLDIKYKQNKTTYKSSLSKTLSNFYMYNFFFEGIRAGSIEGVLQSFKVSDYNHQIEYAKYFGYDAYALRATTPDWKEEGVLYWKAKKIDRFSIEYQDLLNRLYITLFIQSEVYRGALYNSKDHVLYHFNPNANEKTILTSEEYLTRLTILRNMLLNGYKRSDNKDYIKVKNAMEENTFPLARRKSL